MRRIIWASAALATLTVTATVSLGCSSSSGNGATSSTDAGHDAIVGTGSDAGHDGTAPTEAGSDAMNDGASDSAIDALAGLKGPTARFLITSGAMPDFMNVPFPSDVYLTDGHIVDPLPGADAVITSNSKFITHELGKLNGFSPIAQSTFYIDDPAEAGGVATIDATTLPVNEAACVADTSAVFLVDLSATGAAARIPCRAAFHDDRFIYGDAGDVGYRPALSVGPGRGIVLEEGHQYATVVTSRVKTTTGKNILGSTDFLGLTSSKTKSTLYATALSKATTILSSALTSDGATIVALAPYTTGSETKVLLQMRTNLASVAVPPLKWDSASLAPMGATKFAAGPKTSLPSGFTDTLDDYLGVVTAPTLPDGSDDPNADLPVRAHNKIAAVGTAVFQARNYLSPPDGYSELDDATFTLNASGEVIPNATNPTVPIWITFFVPTSPMPATGYPVVIVQHGLGESRQDEAFNLANVFANAGWMVAAIDSVTFGARAAEPTDAVDKVNNFAKGGGGYAGPDGLADVENGLADLFGNLEDIGAIRDQFRESEIDTSQLARELASNPDLSPLQTGDTVPMIDATKIAYFGNSLGAIEGAAAAAIEPLIKTWVLNVAGGGLLLELAPHAPLIATELEFAGANFGADEDHLNESHLLMNVLQTAVDPGDPLVYAPYLVKNPGTVSGTALSRRNVLQIQVVYDEYVPNEANEALARAIGIGLATPNVGTNGGVSTLAMVKDPTTIPDRLTLTDVNPDDAGLIHDTPMTGTTAVLVQTMPGQHGDNFQEGRAAHNYAIPYNRFTSLVPFVKLGAGAASADPPFSITCSYLYQQSMAVRFLSDAFQGTVPNVTGFLPAVRDFDGDGVLDTNDSDVNNPNVH